MSASKLINALDQYSNRSIGENECPQYNWSKESKEQLLQIYFQLVLSKKITPAIDMYKNLLNRLFENYEENREMIQYCYKLIAQTRDIIDGKGLYTLSYALLGEWVRLCYVENKANIENVNQALRYFVQNGQEHAFGSWKDLKYFANYCVKNIDGINKHSCLIRFICKMYGEGLANEFKNKDDRALIAKWAPREKSKMFGWLTPIIAHYFCNSFSDLNLSIPSSRIKQLKLFRKSVGSMNRSLDTTQIKQCNKEWSSINFNNVTSITMNKQAKAFSYTNTTSHKDDPDRIACANNLKKYIQEMKENVKQGKQGIKGKRVAINDMIKKAIYFNQNHSSENGEVDILELQWKDNKTQNGALDNFIAMVDVSGSMAVEGGLPLHSAIALGIRCSECSKISNRVLTFSENPEWIIYNEEDSLLTKTYKTLRGDWGMNTNFEAAYTLILEACITNNMSPGEISNMTILVLSDMQFDQAKCRGVSKETMFENIKKTYYNAGMKTHGVPYTPPGIVFWNLRPTDGFPSLSTTKNVAMVSGNSPVLLNAFVNKGPEFLKDINPWMMFLEIIENERYNCMNLI